MPTVIEADTDGYSGPFAHFEPLGRASIGLWAKVFDAVSEWKGEPQHFSFDYGSNRLRLSGESEYSGDRVARVRALYDLMAFNTYAWMAFALYAMICVAEFGLYSPESLPFLLVVLLSKVMVLGGRAAFKECEIIDYTTEPTPDMDDLDQQYLDGELDEDELESRKEARLE